jgi:hypothetical protein
MSTKRPVKIKMGMHETAPRKMDDNPNPIMTNSANPAKSDRAQVKGSTFSSKPKGQQPSKRQMQWKNAFYKRAPAGTGGKK